MRIILDEEVDANGHHLAYHVFHTEATPQNQIQDPQNAAQKIDRIQFVARIHKGTMPIAGTGWDRVTTLPQYAGKTLLDVLRAEIVRLNDAAARAVLGI